MKAGAVKDVAETPESRRSTRRATCGTTRRRMDTLGTLRASGRAGAVDFRPYLLAAAIIGGGAGLGAAIGALAGGGKGALIGAGIGGGAGTGTVLATKGKEIHYSPETRLTFTLARSIEV